MRKKIVAGNWKMNKTLDEGALLLNGIKKVLEEKKLENAADSVIIAPSFIHLAVFSKLKNNSFELAGQNCAAKESGAYTGEVSAAMLKSAGAEFVIIGHSERRLYFKESSEELAEKVDVAIKEGLKVIFCCGESLEERESGKYFQTVASQLKSSIFHLSEKDFNTIIIAYEPVWAIGTGLTASSFQAQEMHQFIRSEVSSKYGKAISESISILYGGSCNAANAKELFSNPDVDGGLIGGASLKIEDFVEIINSF